MAKMKPIPTTNLTDEDIKFLKQREYRQQNKKRINAVRKKWVEKNRDRLREISRRWKTGNGKEWSQQYQKEYTAKWRAENPDYQKKWRKRNKDKVRKYNQRAAEKAKNGT